MRIKPLLATLPLLLLTPSPATLANGDVDLLAKMSQLQYLSHKAELAVDHENRPLAGFYAHELEETLEAVEEIESYDGHPIGELAKAMAAGGTIGGRHRRRQLERRERRSGRPHALLQCLPPGHGTRFYQGTARRR